MSFVFVLLDKPGLPYMLVFSYRYRVLVLLALPWVVVKHVR